MGAEKNRLGKYGLYELNAMLLDAVKEGRLAKLKRALNLGADANAYSDEGLAALHIAAFYLDINLSELLIANGANVNAKGKFGWTALHIASIKEGKELAELLIAKGANVNAKDNDGMTPLHRAVIHSSSNVAALLIANGADVNAQNGYGWTPLHIAIIDENKEIAQLLISHGADVNVQDEKGMTPLHYVVASNSGNKELAELLASHGANIELKDNFGMTPLDYGNDDINKVIQTAILTKMLFNVVLFAAVENGNVEVSKNALALGADINAQDEDGWTPLHIAAIKADKVLAAFLVENGARLDIKDNFGRVPLDYGGDEMKESINYAMEKRRAMEKEQHEDKNSFMIKNIWKGLRRQH